MHAPAFFHKENTDIYFNRKNCINVTTESLILSNTSEGINPKTNTKSASGNNVIFSRGLRSVRAVFHTEPPFKFTGPKNIRCKVHKKYAAPNRIPNAPQTAIQ